MLKFKITHDKNLISDSLCTVGRQAYGKRRKASYFRRSEVAGGGDGDDDETALQILS